MARTKSTNRTAMVAGRKTRGNARGAAVAASTSRLDANQDVTQVEWEDVTDELDVIQDIDGLLNKPAANRSNENEARRRIEMLREERLLQQALSDVFDL